MDRSRLWPCMGLGLVSNLGLYTGSIRSSDLVRVGRGSVFRLSRPYFREPLCHNDFDYAVNYIRIYLLADDAVDGSIPLCLKGVKGFRNNLHELRDIWSRRSILRKQPGSLVPKTCLHGCGHQHVYQSEFLCNVSGAWPFVRNRYRARSFSNDFARQNTSAKEIRLIDRRVSRQVSSVDDLHLMFAIGAFANVFARRKLRFLARSHLPVSLLRLYR